MTAFLLDSDIAEIVERITPKAAEFAGKTILLTGGCGFLGRYFIAVFDALNVKVLERPIKLVVMDNMITAGDAGSQMPDLMNARFVKHDVIQPYDWN